MIRELIVIVTVLLPTVHAFATPAALQRTPISTTSITQLAATDIDTSFMWNRGLNFGKGNFKFYQSFEDWMKVFPDEDKAAYPDVFNLPTGVYEVALTKPLGIVFEEIEQGRGLYVQDLVEDGNAAQSGKVQVGDVLVGITAVKIVGAKYERRIIPARKFDFDTMVGAVNSNDPKWGCSDVVLMFERPGESDSKKTDDFMDFFEPPFDNPWKQAQIAMLSPEEMKATSGVERAITTDSVATTAEFNKDEKEMIRDLHDRFEQTEPREVLEESLPTMSPSLVYRIRRATESTDPIIQKVATEVNELLEKQLQTATNTLKELLNAGEIRKLDSLIGRAQREGRLDTAFFNVLTVNLQDAAKMEQVPTEEGAASRLQILQHIYTRCQEEVEKSIPPGMALLNKLLRTPQDSIRANLYEHYLTPQRTKITSPDGKEIQLDGDGAPLVALKDFIDAIAQTVKQIRTVETIGAVARESAAGMVESCRTVAKEARMVIGEKFGIESDELSFFETGLQPVFRPASAESPYITGEA